jgi:hypothetical protein
MIENMMPGKKLTGLLIAATFFLATACTSQENVKTGTGNPDDLINVQEVTRIEKVLASDEMQGRKVYTPGIDKAADFIASEFKSIGLDTWNNSGSFRQDFSLVSPKQTSASCMLGNTAMDEKSFIVVTTQPALSVNEKSGYEKVRITKDQNLGQESQKYVRSGKNYIVLVDTSFTKNFGRLSAFLKRTSFEMKNNVVLVLTTEDPSAYSIEARHDITQQKLANVVAVLPGKSKKDEYVIFSGHYDHLGIGKPVNGDSIYNGANDDAAGTTAVIMLAKYFKALNNNERTIVFAAFTAEESGGHGSQYFSKQFSADKVMAMFNIEMIGTESKWGKNSAYITGYEKTDMGTILQKNLEGSGFTFHPDPYPAQQLFYRSDNATLARLGVPAHTISTSKMDSEPNYHKVTDHVETLDLDNMTRIIKSIAISSKSIVAGADTPSRVKVEELR